MESRDIERVLGEMLRTFEEKNALYGNSFEESLREWGALVGVSRIGDKMRRLKSLWMSSGCDIMKSLNENTIKKFSFFS